MNEVGALRDPPAQARGRRRGRDWVVIVPLGLLVAAITVLAIYTTWIRVRTQELRQKTEQVYVPARNAAQDLIVAMALEIEGLYEFTYSGVPSAASDYSRGAAARRAAMLRLEQLLPRLSGEPARHVDRLLHLARIWDAASQARLEAERAGGSAAARPRRDLEEMFRETLVEATLVQRALSESNERARAAINSMEDLDWYYTLMLVVLSLGASFFIADLVRRVRRLADISEWRRRESERLTEVRARLIRGISHDVKNPLGAADGYAQLLEMGVEGQLTERQRAAVARIRRGIGSALAIISDLLELSRAEAGMLSLDLAPVDVTSILREVVADYEARADSAGVWLEANLADDEIIVNTDGRRVGEIVGNLLSNAIKFSPVGGHVRVETSIHVDGAAPDAGRWLAVSVEDEGPGVTPDERERIFEEFYQAAPAAAAGRGVGLGLAISRRVARLLGGDITVESEPGKGSTFTLWLRLDAAARVRRAA